MSTLIDWFRAHRSQIIILSLGALIAAFSFGLGYLLSSDSDRAPIIIEQQVG